MGVTVEISSNSDECTLVTDIVTPVAAEGTQSVT